MQVIAHSVEGHECHPLVKFRMGFLGGPYGLDGLVGAAQSLFVNHPHRPALIKDEQVVDSGYFVIHIIYY